MTKIRGFEIRKGDILLYEDPNTTFSTKPFVLVLESMPLTSEEKESLFGSCLLVFSLRGNIVPVYFRRNFVYEKIA